MPEVKTDDIFNKLKKQNGEKFAQAIRGDRDHDGSLLVIPNILHILEFAGNDEEDARKLRPILKEVYLTKQDSRYSTNKTPLELLNEAGYDAFVVKNEKQKNSIKKYYRPGEELCTFNDPHRHEDYYIIHAIKHNAKKIKPSNHPEREDEYGTSVISIQIAKTGGFISIKNRYNHTVNNPDATFDNNPDNIIHGLSNSLKHYFNVEFNTTENPLPDNYRMVNDQFVYFNYEIDDTYFGPDYYFFGSNIAKLNKDYEIMLDYFILDTQTGTLSQIYGTEDCAYSVLNNRLKNKKIRISSNPNNKHEYMIFADNDHVLSVENGEITELNLPDMKDFGKGFLSQNKKLKKFNAPKLENIYGKFFPNNEELTELDFPELKNIYYHGFLSKNKKLRKFNAPKLENITGDFLRFNEELTELNLPSLKEVGTYFLSTNKKLKKFNAPKLKWVGGFFLSENEELTELDLPSLEEIYTNFLKHNKKLKRFNAPKLEKVDYDFLSYNQELTDITVADKKIINKKLAMIIAKNKTKQKIKNRINNLINSITLNDYRLTD